MGRIKPAERDAIIRALRVGLVPRSGLQHLQVGRAREIRTLAEDAAHVTDGGGATIRFVVGDYGAGKTFLLGLARLIALEKGMLVLSADLGPERRLHGNQGQARQLYASLAASAATAARPAGGALDLMVERFTHAIAREAQTSGTRPGEIAERHLEPLTRLPGGFDWLDVLSMYQQAWEEGDAEDQEAALRWIRGEYASVTEARERLGVRKIVNDRNIYDSLKNLATFVHAAGYGGTLITLDELGTLAKITSAASRRSNYEQILSILNDVHQGTAPPMGIILAGVGDTVTNTRRGLFSIDALASRLAENSYARDGLVDYEHPILQVDNLTPEELFLLLQKVRDVMQKRSQLPDSGLRQFLAHCAERIGSAYFRTPRATITGFVNLMAVIEQNPGADWKQLIARSPDQGRGARRRLRRCRRGRRSLDRRIVRPGRALRRAYD